MTIGSLTGIMNWTPNVGQVGNHTIKVSVTDGETTVFQQYTLTVDPLPNHAPVITSTPGTSVIATNLYQYNVTATDADADLLNFVLVTSPAGMTIGSLSGIMNWTPNVGQVGNHTIKVSVTDGETTVFQQYTLTVDPLPNHAPVITSTPGTSVIATNLYQYNVTATDVDADLLNFGLVTSPAGMTIGSLTGIMSWTPTVGQVGNHTIKVSVTDGETTVFQQYTLTVSAPPNHAPEITSYPGLSGTCKVLYTYQVTAIDVDGDILSYSLETFPAGMTINTTTGLISWTPSRTQFGNILVNVIVSDGDLSVSQQYGMNVPMPPNSAPVISTTPVTTVIVGQLYSYDPDATDADGDTLTFSLNYSFSPATMTVDPVSGLLTWTPTASDVGSQNVYVIVTDGLVDEFQSYHVQVSLPNNPPQITSTPGTSVIATNLYQYNVTATDADADLLNFGLVTSPAGMTIGSLTGIMNWTPTVGQVGNHTIKVSVSDGETTVFQQYILTVDPLPNHPPVITSTAVTTATVGSIYNYQVTATDADGDVLYYYLEIAPAGLTIGTLNAYMAWFPDFSQVGNLPVRVKVTDGKDTVYQEYTVTVSLPPNHAPVITSTPAVTAVVGVNYNYQATATDADGDALYYFLDISYTGMSMNLSTGLLTWIPTVAQVGNVSMRIMVTDGKDPVYQEFTITVSEPPNNAPVITSSPILSTVATNLYQYNVTATDADADLLTYALVTSPAGMTIGFLTGNIGWTPSAGQVGNHTIKVSVTDGETTVFQQYTLTVSAPPNTAPVITSTAVTSAICKVLYTYQVTATDADGDILTYSLQIFPVGMIINNTTGEISWTPTKLQSGNHIVKVIVSDGDLSVFQQFTINVPVPANIAPVITSLPDGDTVIVEQLYSYDVNATDADGDTLTYYLYGTIPAGMVIDPVSGLLTWTPTMAQEGSYTVHIAATDGLAGGYQMIYIRVRFTNYAPVFNTTPVLTATSGLVYNYDSNAWDSDGDAVTYFLATSPANMIINDITGLISWVPTAGQTGNNVIKIGATDGKVTTYQEYTIVVSLAFYSEIVITSVAPQTATQSTPYNYGVQATDSLGHTLDYILLDKPTGMSINSVSGLISWTPGAGTVGSHWVVVEVTDGATSAYQYYIIRVNPTDNGIPYIRACVFTTWWYQDLDGIKGESTVLRMHEDGCDTLSIVITGYQASTTSTTIYRSATKTPTDAGITHITNFAHSLGMSVYFKVHVDIPAGTWRGYITFATVPEWTAWFTSYDALMAHYLDLAESLGVEGFVIGTELVGTEARESNWRNTISLARGKFSGLISYCANHDSYSAINWWDDLDFIGISAYFPLTSSYTPTVAQLNTAWLPWISNLSTFSAIWNMDIVFLELGYQSRNGTNISPWWAPSTAVDLQEQADCYQAAFESLSDEPWFKGMAWWMWYWDPAQNIDGFDVYNKPAESILRYNYAGY
jgi:hypothetical protein